MLTPVCDPDPAENGCFELSLEEARTLADVLLSPSAGGEHAYQGIVFNFIPQPLTRPSRV